MKNKLFDFLENLAENNNRPWFQAHKAEFDSVRAAWLDDIDRLIAAMAQWEPSYKWLSAKDCVFRIYRDTRFSQDKTPYKTYFSAAFSPHGKKTDMAGYYIAAGVGDCGIYGGIWAPEAPVLKKLRRAIVDNIEEFDEIISEPRLNQLYPHWWGDTLKTVPKGYPKDHPQAHLLRLLHYGRQHELSPDFFTKADWPELAAGMMRPLKPLVDFLNYSILE